MGCQLDVQATDNDALTVQGNACKLGRQYAQEEFFHPRRVVTSTVRVKNGRYRLVPVWTTGPVPMNRIFDVMKELEKIEVEAPVKAHQTIVKNILGLKVDIETSGTVARHEEHTCRKSSSNQYEITA